MPRFGDRKDGLPFLRSKRPEGPCNCALGSAEVADVATAVRIIQVAKVCNQRTHPATPAFREPHHLFDLGSAAFTLHEVRRPPVAASSGDVSRKIDDSAFIRS